jgi:hypothetical protein
MPTLLALIQNIFGSEAVVLVVRRYPRTGGGPGRTSALCCARSSLAGAWLFRPRLRRYARRPGRSRRSRSRSHTNLLRPSGHFDNVVNLVFIPSQFVLWETRVLPIAAAQNSRNYPDGAQPLVVPAGAFANRALWLIGSSHRAMPTASVEFSPYSSGKLVFI